MASPVADEAFGGRIDRLSDLPDHVLLQTLSFLPTHIAARTSLLSRRFRYLWKESPGIHFELSSFDRRFNDFREMVDRSFLQRDFSSPLLHLSLHLKPLLISFSLIPTLLVRASSFRIRHLVIELGYELGDHFLPTIFCIPSLKSLSVKTSSCIEKQIDPSLIAPAGLRSLSLSLYSIEPAVLSVIVSKLPLLEDLELRVMDTVDLCSQTIKRLTLGLEGFSSYLRICIPSLESLDFSHSGSMGHFQGEMPLLEKAVINIDRISENSAVAIYEVLKTVANVQDLLIHIEEDWNHGNPFHNLAEPDKDPPIFPNLKRLDLSICFHYDNIDDLVSLLQHSPALETLKLVHKPPFVTNYWKVEKPMLWKSKLPRIGGNNEHASFFNLHIRNKKKDLIKRLTGRLNSKRRKP